MIEIYRQLFLSTRFFIIGSFIVALFAVSFVFSWLFAGAIILLIFLFIATIIDSILLLSKKQILEATRDVDAIMSLGDENKVVLIVKNYTEINIFFTFFDDLPFQLQWRDFKIESKLKSHEKKKFEYFIIPRKRGEYVFGNLNFLVSSSLGFVSKKIAIEQKKAVHVYPSIIQLKKYELKSLALFQRNEGIKKLRRIGHSYEFEQIKEYVLGDDSRTINWKASGRRATLMVNQYEDERSQQVYSIIDKSRTMRMSFGGMSLLDYSINASLVLSNIVLQKHDRAGLISFSDKIGTIIPAEKKSHQLRKILEALYNEKENFLEAEYELLYHLVRNVIRNRSLIFLYTNFESIHSFHRILPILRHINKLHLLVVVFFDNEEVVALSKKPVKKLNDIYTQTMARKYLFEKNQIVSDMNNYGIHCIKTQPSELSIHSINKYLELKSRGMI